MIVGASLAIGGLAGCVASRAGRPAADTTRLAEPHGAADTVRVAADSAAAESAAAPDPRCTPLHKGAVDQNASVLDFGVPHYPPAARERRVEGTVRVRAVIGVDGALCEAEAIDGPAILRGAAIDAARCTRISPAMIGGVAVPVRVTIPIVFSLEKAEKNAGVPSAASARR
jgi:protein TonB